MKSVSFFYYGIDPTTGNKKKFQFCFRHAVAFVMQTGPNEGITLETEVLGHDDYVHCDECAK